MTTNNSTNWKNRSFAGGMSNGDADGATIDALMAKARRFPLLSPEQEADLASKWKNEGDFAAKSLLINSHLRFAAKAAMGFRGYKLPMADLLSQALTGLVVAADKFEPAQGFRFATYAQWWIKAELHEYVLKNTSMVKMGTTAATKKLFYKLNATKANLNISSYGELSPQEAEAIAIKLDVQVDEVVMMNRRMSGLNENTLNIRMSEGEGDEAQELLVDASPLQDELLADHEILSERRRALHMALEGLTPREKDIIEKRHLSDDVATLDDLSKIHGVSRERIRQVEVKALAKVRIATLATAQNRIIHQTGV